MTYIELKKKHQKEVDAFPFGFAFSTAQFNDMMRGWGLTPDDTDKIYSLPGGGFVRKSDAAAMDEMFERHDRERKASMEEDKTGEGYIKEMFAYELANHEYGYTHELDDTLDALGLTLAQVKKDKRLRHGLNSALSKYYDFAYKV